MYVFLLPVYDYVLKVEHPVMCCNNANNGFMSTWGA